MKKFSKALICFIMLLGIVSFSTQTFAQERVSLYVDGKLVNLTGSYLKLIDGKSFLPLRAISEELGAKVAYYSSSQSVIISRNGRESKFFLYGTTYYVNGKKFTSSVIPIVENGVTYLPTREVGNALGVIVKWDSTKYDVVILDKGESKVVVNKDGDETIYLNNVEATNFVKSVDDYTDKAGATMEGLALLAEKIPAIGKYVAIAIDGGGLLADFIFNTFTVKIKSANEGHGVIVKTNFIGYPTVTPQK